MHPTARKLRETIASGQPVIGTFLVEFSQPAAVQVLADAGFDFVMIDCEHGNHTPRDIEALAQAGMHAGVCVLARAPSAGRELITRALDAGAGGVLVPAVASMEHVLQAVQATKYRPVGRRGVHLLRGHTLHRRVDAASFLAEANRDVLTLIQIELESAVALVDEIAAVDGVDGLYIGPGDLSVDLGVPGQWDAPVLQAAIRRTAEACRTHGKILACHGNSVEAMPSLGSLGVRMFGYDCDTALFKAASEELVRRFRQAMTIGD